MSNDEKQRPNEDRMITVSLPSGPAILGMQLGATPMPVAIEALPEGRFMISLDDRDATNDLPSPERFHLPTVREYLETATSVLLIEHDPRPLWNHRTFVGAIADATLRGGVAVMILTDKARMGFWENEIRERASLAKIEILAPTGRWSLNCVGAG